MIFANTLFATAENIALFRELLIGKLGWNEPCGPITQIPQWAGFTRSIGMSEALAPHFGMTYLDGGYFYNFHNDAPNEQALIHTLENGKAAGAHSWLVPTVADNCDAAALRKAGFAPLPAYVESALVIEKTLESTLRNTLGSRRLLDFQRITRKAETIFEVEFHLAPSLISNPHLIDLAGDLHSENAKKYGHPFNMYDAVALRRILDSKLGKSLTIGFVRNKANQEPVQVILALWDFERKQLHYLAQGLRHDHVPGSINLYTASYLWLYRFAETLGAQKIFLSRGMHEAKRRLGANTWALLNNWVYSQAPDTKQVIATAQTKAEQIIAGPFRQFCEKGTTP